MSPTTSHRGLLAFAAALMLCLFAPFARAQDTLSGGETGIGTLPVVKTLTGSVDFVCVRSRVANAPTTIHRHLAGEPGVTITARHGSMLLIASSDEPGSQAATGDSVTASWTSGGTLFTVTCTQLPNETDDDFARRVDAKVRAFQRIRPRDGPQTQGNPNHP